MFRKEILVIASASTALIAFLILVFTCFMTACDTNPAEPSCSLAPTTLTDMSKEFQAGAKVVAIYAASYPLNNRVIRTICYTYDVDYCSNWFNDRETITIFPHNDFDRGVQYGLSPDD
jgi:hypothetical protein